MIVEVPIFDLFLLKLTDDSKGTPYIFSFYNILMIEGSPHYGLTDSNVTPYGFLFLTY